MYLLLVSWSTLSSSQFLPLFSTNDKLLPSSSLVPLASSLTAALKLPSVSYSSLFLQNHCICLFSYFARTQAQHITLLLLQHRSPQVSSAAVTMILSPEMIKAAPTASTSVAPIPTIVPTPPHIIAAGDAGNKTLWYAHIGSTEGFNC
jgi:hypothetical protein